MPSYQPHGPRREPQFAIDAPIYPAGLTPPESGAAQRQGGAGVAWALCFGSLVAGITAGSLWVVQPLRAELATKDAQWAAASQRVALLEQELQAKRLPPAPPGEVAISPAAPRPAAAAQAAQALRAQLAGALDGPIGRGLVAVHQDELAVVLRVPCDVAASAQLPQLLRTLAQVVAAIPGAATRLGLEVRLQGTAPRRSRGRDVFAARLTALVRAVDATFHHGPDDLAWHVGLGAASSPWGSLALSLRPRDKTP